MRSIEVNSERTFGERLMKYFRAPFPIYDHVNITGHHICVDNFSFVGKELYDLTRTIKEAMYIRVSDPSLNRNISKFQLSHILDEVLLNIQDPKLK